MSGGMILVLAVISTQLMLLVSGGDPCPKQNMSGIVF